MKALKPFIDSNQNLIKRGQSVKKSDYRQEVWNVMVTRGLVGDEVKPTKNKMAKPQNKKGKKK